MKRMILIEKFENFSFPKYKVDDTQFIQGNKAIFIKKDKYKKRHDYAFFQVGYLVIPRRDVPLQLYQDSVKNYVKFKENFIIKIDAKNEKGEGEQIEFKLYSITLKETHFIFGFKFSNSYYTGCCFDQEKMVPIDIFLSALKKTETLILTYEKLEIKKRKTYGFN